VLRLLDETIDHTRDLTQELFPQILYEAGLVAGLEWLADQHRRLHGTAVEFTASHLRVSVRDEVAITLFQATRELLHNVAKHARADSVQIGIALRPNEVEVTVVDDGVGLDPEILETYGKKHMGFGLFNLRERLEHVGGRLEIHPRRGGGTKAVVIAPARPTDAEAP
jgi:signal transduction histidine kinase